MTKKVLIALVAAIGPLFYAVAIGIISLEVKGLIPSGLDNGPVLITCLWPFLWGILAAILLYLTVSVFPKHGGLPLVWGAGIGGVLVLAEALVYIAPEVFWNVIPLHFHVETPTLSVCGLFLAGNIICMIRTLRRNKTEV